jgi:hypothetical protein
MKKYGLRIGTVGVEFTNIVDRDKALKDFTQGSDVSINELGIKFSDGKGNFSVYDRDTKEIITSCCKCKGEFTIDSCKEREYPYLYYGSEVYSSSTGFICDACLIKEEKAKEVFEAKQILSKENN